MTASSQAHRRVRLPRTWGLRASDVAALVAGNAVLIVAMWVRHGNLDELHSPTGIVTAAGQLTALLGTYAILIQLVLMSRSPWLDQLFGMDRLAWAHRWLGFAALWLLLGHTVLTTVGYAVGDGSTVFGEAGTLLMTYPYVLMATAAMGLIVVVAGSSIRVARRRLSYETWYGVHLYAYLAIALGFGHQLAVGTDFASDPAAQAYWVFVYLMVIGLILVFRIGQPAFVSLRHGLRVDNVVGEGPGVVSVYVTGRHLDQLAVRSGQWFVWRFLTRDGWWRAHPFSLSAAPNGRWLRFTIKQLGDYTSHLQGLRRGTRVVVEGPYGILTGARRTKPRVLLIAGGIGITPLRALLEALSAKAGDLTLIYRASRPEDVIFRDELDQLMRSRGATVHYFIGRRGSRTVPTDPLEPPALRRLVPDIAERDVFMCGPVPMMEAVRHSLRALRVPDSQIHWERFSY